MPLLSCPAEPSQPAPMGMSHGKPAHTEAYSKLQSTFPAHGMARLLLLIPKELRFPAEEIVVHFSSKLVLGATSRVRWLLAGRGSVPQSPSNMLGPLELPRDEDPHHQHSQMAARAAMVLTLKCVISLPDVGLFRSSPRTTSCPVTSQCPPGPSLQAPRHCDVGPGLTSPILQHLREIHL